MTSRKVLSAVSTSVLPRPRKHSHRAIEPAAQFNPLRIPNPGGQRDLFENSPGRRDDDATVYILKTESAEQNIEPQKLLYKLLHSDDANVSRLKKVKSKKRFTKMYGIPRSKTLYGFDKNGMLFLTKPKNNDARQLNYLMSKLVQYNLKGDGTLRQPNLFSHKELEQLKELDRAIDEENSLNAPEAEKGEPEVEVGGPEAILGGAEAIVGGPVAIARGPKAIAEDPEAILGGPEAIVGKSELAELVQRLGKESSMRSELAELVQRLGKESESTPRTTFEFSELVI